MTAPADVPNATTATPKKRELNGRRLFATPEVIFLLVTYMVIINLLDPTQFLDPVVNVMALAIGSVVLMLTISSGEWIMASIGAAVFMGLLSGLLIDSWDLGPGWMVIPGLAALGYLQLISINFSRRRDPGIEPEPIVNLFAGWVAVAMISGGLAYVVIRLNDPGAQNSWLWLAGAVGLVFLIGFGLGLGLIRGAVSRDRRRVVPGQRLLRPPE